MLNGDFSSSLLNISQLKIGLEGAYQQENATLALQTFLLFMREEKEVVDEQADKGQQLKIRLFPDRQA